MTPAEREISERLHELVQLQLEGTPTADEQREFAQLLRDHPWVQELYIETIQDTASLRWWSANVPITVAGREIVPLEPTPVRLPARLKRKIPLLAALAASIVVLLSATLVSHLRRQPPTIEIAKPDEHRMVEPEQSPNQLPIQPPKLADVPPETKSSASVALVTRLRGVEWNDGAPALAELTPITVGQVLQFKQGEMEVVFDQGVKLAIRGPAHVQIRSAREVFSTSGVLSARVGKTGIGFTIETPTGRIIDQGTEFGVAIDDRGGTDVAVFRGAVDLTYGPRTSKIEPSVSRRLVQGQALRLDSDGHMRRLVSVDYGRFPNINADALRSATGRPSLITSVRDNIRDGVDAKSYRIVAGGLREDCSAYVDREHEWNGVTAAGIPPVLLGADYVMPFNGDKLLPTLSVKVTIGEPAMLYVFLSDVAREPDWLKKDFVKTEMRIGLDESAEYSNPNYRLATGPGQGINTLFSVWSKKITAPTTVTLGGIVQGQARWGYCMYGIAAVPLERAESMAREQQKKL